MIMTVFAAVVAAVGAREMSSSAWVKFDSLPCADAGIAAPYRLAADGDGRWTLTFGAAPTEMLGDYAATTRDGFKAGEWHHLEVSYSLLRKRVAVYVDGAFQFENDLTALPVLATSEGKSAPSKGCAVKDFRTWDWARDVDELALAADGKTSQRDANRARENAVKRELFAKWDPSGTKPAAIYVVKPYTAELFSPYALPKDGRLGGTIAVFGAPDQSVAGSALVIALKAPLTVGGVKVSALKNEKGDVFPAEDVDVKIVKRWYRNGGAWLSYQGDKRQRMLVEDLIMNDDAAIRVDEATKRNYLRLEYPEGVRYTDVSDADFAGETQYTRHIPFRDAATLQPVTIPEWGRTQRFLLTFHIAKGAKPGVYRGTAEFVNAGTLPVELNVLPIELPYVGSPYWSTKKSYIALENSMPIPCGRDLAEREATLKRMMRDVRRHQIVHAASLWDTPEYVALAKEAGFHDPDRIFSKRVEWIPDWRCYFPDKPLAALTAEDREKGQKAARRYVNTGVDYFARQFAHNPEIWTLFHSEYEQYSYITTSQEGPAAIAHELGYRLFSHTMTDGGEMYIMGDIQDMVSDVRVSREQARVWHEAGGEIISYANPFPSGENPEYFRRKIGLGMYKNDYDGDMMHECIHYENPYNEFMGGGYRNFNMGFPYRGGVIWKIAFDGLREAHNDVRYLTALKTRAERLLSDPRDAAKREAKRQLIWLASVDPVTADLDMVRAAAAERIQILDRFQEVRHD